MHEMEEIPPHKLRQRFLLPLPGMRAACRAPSWVRHLGTPVTRVGHSVHLFSVAAAQKVSLHTPEESSGNEGPG